LPTRIPEKHPGGADLRKYFPDHKFIVTTITSMGISCRKYEFPTGFEKYIGSACSLPSNPLARSTKIGKKNFLRDDNIIFLKNHKS